MASETREECLAFACAGERLFGILSVPAVPGETGVLVLVGGPQYRVGSHRQFTLLARALAEAGYPALRFDFRGMGDSEGDPRDFLAVEADIAAAIDAFVERFPAIRRIVLWGLCDAASAALLYLRARRDRRVAGLCLLNPWVRSEATQAQTQVRHYYVRRFLAGAFWRKLVSGQVNVLGAVSEFLLKAALASRRQSAVDVATESFQKAMARAWRDFPGPIVLILSGQDDTAREFELLAGSDLQWRGLLTRGNVRRVDLPDANHTFASRRHRDEAAQAVIDWLPSVGAAP